MAMIIMIILLIMIIIILIILIVAIIIFINTIAIFESHMCSWQCRHFLHLNNLATEAWSRTAPQAIAKTSTHQKSNSTISEGKKYILCRPCIAHCISVLYSNPHK